MRKTVNLILTIIVIFASSAIYSQDYELSSVDKNGLSSFLIEERLVNDFYLQMNEQWDIPIFNKISNSEVENLLIVQSILDNHKISDPAIFLTESALNANYNTLLASGQNSVVDALKASAKVEEMDIDKLDELISKTKNDELLHTYRLLKKLSEQHLRSITLELNKYGVVYNPEIIAPDHYKSLL